MAGKPEELSRTVFNKEGTIIVGEQELTNFCGTMIRIYMFKNRNRLPVKIIFPKIEKAGGVPIEWSTTE